MYPLTLAGLDDAIDALAERPLLLALTAVGFMTTA